MWRQNEGRRFIEQADPGKMNRIKKEAVFMRSAAGGRGMMADQAYRRAYPPQACKNRVKRMAMERSSRKVCNLKQPKEKRQNCDLDE